MVVTDIEQTLARVLERLAGLEQREAGLLAENAALRAEVNALRGRETRLGAEATLLESEPLSRRWLLRRGAQAAAASLAAGMLLQRDAQPAAAEHFDTLDCHVLFVDGDIWSEPFDTTSVPITGQSHSTHPGIRGRNVIESVGGVGVAGEATAAGGMGVSGTAGAPNGIGVYGTGQDGIKGYSTAANGAGVRGDNTAGAGVYGSSAGYGYEGVYGVHTGEQGYGVVGDGKGNLGTGVWGRNNAGDGTRGDGKIGIHGKSTTTTGYGGLFEGGKAQLRLVPGSAAGKPSSGNHVRGEFYLDSACTLFICTVSGSPGTWRKLSTVAS